MHRPQSGIQITKNAALELIRYEKYRQMMQIGVSLRTTQQRLLVNASGAENMTDEELRAMIDEFDTDGDGEINLEDFVAIMTGDT